MPGHGKETVVALVVKGQSMRVFYGFLGVGYVMLRGPVNDVQLDRSNIIGIAFVLRQCEFNIHYAINSATNRSCAVV